MRTFGTIMFVVGILIMAASAVSVLIAIVCLIYDDNVLGLAFSVPAIFGSVLGMALAGMGAITRAEASA